MPPSSSPSSQGQEKSLFNFGEGMLVLQSCVVCVCVCVWCAGAAGEEETNHREGRNKWTDLGRRVFFERVLFFLGGGGDGGDTIACCFVFLPERMTVF